MFGVEEGTWPTKWGLRRHGCRSTLFTLLQLNPLCLDNMRTACSTRPSPDLAHVIEIKKKILVCQGLWLGLVVSSGVFSREDDALGGHCAGPAARGRRRLSDSWIMQTRAHECA